MIRALVLGAFVSASSWVLLVLVLGNTGLQRAVSTGLINADAAIGYVAAFVMSTAVALVAAVPTRPLVLASVVFMLALDAVAALIGVTVVGELEVDDLLVLFALASAVGLQPVGYLVGALAKHRLRHATPRHA